MKMSRPLVDETTSEFAGIIPDSGTAPDGYSITFQVLVSNVAFSANTRPSGVVNVIDLNNDGYIVATGTLISSGNITISQTSMTVRMSGGSYNLAASYPGSVHNNSISFKSSQSDPNPYVVNKISLT